MTSTRKTTTFASTADTAAETDSETTPEDTPALAGPPLRHGQSPETVTFAHHLRIDGRDYKPGETAQVSPDYARQLRGNGYVARGRA
ncbi:hypothetical protein KUF83_29975 [Streptomyces sp. BV286]|uniref:hypothetical protein n=1 Tax=Streptomyces sp. BV286 TaxID=2849672 RepID=UPI001C2EEDCF|nr:hypothetical protein [Streptomyces sp. BV286]MBV1940764.1 hypothetical protein [Streptomyces sp. BV286]